MRKKINQLFRRIWLGNDPDDSSHPLGIATPKAADHGFMNPVRLTESWLRAHRPSDQPPALLHGQIMARIRGMESSKRSPRATVSLFQLSPAAMAFAFSGAVVVAVLSSQWWLPRRPTLTSKEKLALRQLASVLESCQGLARTIPVAVMSPLSDEWSCLRSDTDRATDIVMASLPPRFNRDTAYQWQILPH